MSEITKDLYAATEQTIGLDSYPGYPTDRLVITNAHELNDLTLPDGPWETNAKGSPNQEEQSNLKQQGYELDALGRPLHPWLRDMLANPEVGVVTGTGEYWNWGPNFTADTILLSTDSVPKVLLIKRSDTGKWALPGGFLEDDEDPVVAARRELFEEAGIILAPTEGTQIYSGVVADLRTTAHAWAETTAMLWHTDHTPTVRGSDDAVDAQWFSTNDMPIELHGSHAVLIQSALRSQEPIKTAHIISLPAAESYRHASGGHMAYHRIIATHADGSETFIKSHDKQAFTDPVREAHSKQYLHKEKHMYDHLRSNGFVYIPDFVDQHDDNTITMQALGELNGWQWRAPVDQLEQYVTNTFEAINTLSDLPLPTDFKDAGAPVAQTLKEEGWDILNDESVSHIREKLHIWQSRLRPEFQPITEPFLYNISSMEQLFRSAPVPTNLYLCHHDMRQANIAWHPTQGTRFVDWSWAGTGNKNSDTTMLLIDLHKAGHDVAPFMDRFDSHHAAALVGFWLAHSLMPTQGDDSVRFHQLVSALSAYDLLTKNR